MKSTIRIKTDYKSPVRRPIIEINKIPSDDPRDEMVNDFLETISFGSYMCEVDLIHDGDGLKYHIIPIHHDDDADDVLRTWWQNHRKKKEEANNKSHSDGTIGSQES